MTPLRSSDLRHQVEIRRPTQIANGKGGFVTSWPIVATPWAKVEGLDGRESVMEKVLRGISVKRIRIYWRGDILPSDQLRFNDVDLNIRSSDDPDGKRHELVIIADTDAEQLTAEQLAAIEDAVDGG